jgi:exopolyphosphatase / guanosine-5'-triphosphate,3'-diphosphate pyrophosphatase
MASKNIYTAIDVGSNAIRFLIAKFDEKNNRPINIEYHRIPLRLGVDTFKNGVISAALEKELLSTFKKFKSLIQIHEIPNSNIKAVGTSALRDSKNGPSLCQKIFAETGILINILTGIQEAEFIFFAFKKSWHLSAHPLFLMDLGGGSLEFNLVKKKELISSDSINIGTVRMLSAAQKGAKNYEALWQDFLKQMKKIINRPGGLFQAHIPQISLVGTGGNLRCLGTLRKKILGKKSSDYAKKKDIEKIILIIKNTSIKERIEEFDLRKDRAEVIEVALELIDKVMTIGGFDKIYLPKIGLIDGVIWQLYEKNNKKN